jgi:hypothetical protein
MDPDDETSDVECDAHGRYSDHDSEYDAADNDATYRIQWIHACFSLTDYRYGCVF